jgi:hypothetical protein
MKPIKIQVRNKMIDLCWNSIEHRIDKDRIDKGYYRLNNFLGQVTDQIKTRIREKIRIQVWDNLIK